MRRVMVGAVVVMVLLVQPAGLAAGAPSDDPAAKISARSGRDLIEMQISQFGDDTETVVGSFGARLSSRGQESGRITMEWGADDGRRTSGVVVDIRIRQVTVESADAVSFSGMGTRTDRATGRVDEFPVTGTATNPTAAPDCIIFDIIGGGVHDGGLELPGRFDIKS